MRLRLLCAVLIAATTSLGATYATDDAILEAATLERPEGERRYQLFVPEKLGDEPAIVFALHGSRGDGDRLRRLTARALETHAREDGWVVVYADAYKGSWNGCRKPAVNPAKQEGIDDVAFLTALSHALEGRFGDLPLYVVGFSGGGHMAYRLAAEAGADAPEAVALLSAQVPEEEDSLCGALKAPVNALLVTGTDDPVNPYGGGKVMLGELSLGAVMSANESAAYLAGKRTAGPNSIVNSGMEGADISVWQGAGDKEVQLVTLKGNGHLISGGGVEYPAKFGVEVVPYPTVDAVWSFFRDRRASHGQSGH